MTDSPEQPTAGAIKRRLVRFRNRYGWQGIAAVSAAALCLVAIGVYSVLHLASSGGSVAAASGRYAYEIPKGWTYRVPCNDTPVSGRDLVHDGCTRPPDFSGGAGVYLMSVANQTQAASILGELSSGVAGYGFCSTAHEATEDDPSSTACLQSTSQPQQKGEMRVRMFGSTVVVELCLRTDQPDIEKGCDFVWAHIRLTS